jgi:hypothetical protein
MQAGRYFAAEIGRNSADLSTALQGFTAECPTTSVPSISLALPG